MDLICVEFRVETPTVLAQMLTIVQSNVVLKNVVPFLKPDFFRLSACESVDLATSLPSTHCLLRTC